MKYSKLLLALGLSFAFGVTGLQAEHLVLLTTNDTHSRIDPDFDGKGGILRRKVVFDSVRTAEKNVVAIDAGDAVQGTLYFSMFGGAVEFPLLDSLKYDINILGNHEFDNGIIKLAPYYKNLKSTKLSANYDFSGTVLDGVFKPYEIKEFDGKKVGFIGINLNPDGMISKTNYEGMTYKNAMECANETAEFLKKDKGVDYVVVVSHVGYDSDAPETPGDLDIAKNSRYIDLIVGGHTHTTIKPGGKADWKVKNLDGKDVIITQTGSLGKNVGLIDIDLDNMNTTYRLLPIDKRYDSRANYPELQAFISQYKTKVDSVMNRRIGETARELNRKTALANWVSDAARDITSELSGKKVDFAIMNRGGVRQSFPAGVITEGIIKSTFPFDNFLVLEEITGKQLMESLEIMASRGGDATSSDLIVTFTKDKKIKSAKLNGKKIKPKKKYIMATLDYLANGGDYMKPFTEGKVLFSDNEKLSERVLEYVSKLDAKGIKLDAEDELRMKLIDK